MEQSGAEIAAVKRRNASGDGCEDRLSELPDDVLLFILLRLHTNEAVQTSVLSRRWRRVWTLLPVLDLRFARDPAHLLREVLSASEVPLRCLHIQKLDASPQSLAAWLPTAARRASGHLLLVNNLSGLNAMDVEEAAQASQRQRGTCDLPCFEKATSIFLDLGFLCLSMPPVGVFSYLADLSLNNLHFDGPAELGNVVSRHGARACRSSTLASSGGWTFSPSIRSLSSCYILRNSVICWRSLL